MTALLKKFTLLLIAVPSAMMISLLTSSMTQIYAAYPQYDEMIVTMVLTIPNLTVMIGLVLAPMLLKKYPIKYLVLTGMVIFIGCNLLAGWCQNFFLLLFFRAISGVGCGMILPLQITYLATYPEQERATLMGMGATLSCLFAAVTVAISGIIAAVNWRFVFLLYLVNGAGLIMAVLFLPKQLDMQQKPAKGAEQPSATTGETAGTQETLADYKQILFFYYFLLIGCYLFFCILGSQIAAYLGYYQLGSTAESGFVMSIFQMGSMISGLVLGHYLRLLKKGTMNGLFIIGAVAFFLLGTASAMPVICVAAFLLGFVSALGSCVVSYELSRVLPIHLVASASAGTSFFIFVLQFLSPMLFLALLGGIPSGTYQTVFLLYAAIQLVFLLLAVLLPKVLFQNR